MKRETPFADIVRHLTPFFVSRQVVCGAGRVGRGADGRDDGFQISQRADYFEVEVGLETTLKRPIINTRDEPHADPEKYRRLHVIIGDANMSEVSTYLKLGTTALVLAMIEDGFLAADLAVEAPVADAARRSRTTRRCRHLVTLRDGRTDDRRAAPDGVPRAGPQVRRGPVRRRRRRADRGRAGPLGVACCTGWPSDPMQLSRELDWVAKLEMLEGYRRRDGLDWNHPGCSSSTCSTPTSAPDKGLYNRLAARGRIEPAGRRGRDRAGHDEPPEDTRAYFRGRCLQQYADASPRPPGTRSSSTSRAATRCSAYRPWSRCAAPRRTSASCWTAAAPRRAGRGAHRPALTRPRPAAVLADCIADPYRCRPAGLGRAVGGRG